MVAKHLQNETLESLELKNVTWHREYYREATFKQKIDIAGSQYEKSKLIGYQPRQKADLVPKKMQGQYF